MILGRRSFLRFMATAAVGLRQLLRGRAATAAPTPFGVRDVKPEDAPALSAIMNSCVGDHDAFFGKCGQWPVEWAHEFIARRPQTCVLTQGDEAVAFLEVPPIGPPIPAPDPDATAEELEKYALRQRNRVTYQVRAAGVRYDLLSGDDAVCAFLTILFHAARKARSLGYEYVEAYAPWEGHPMMSRKWTDFPGCELAEPVVRAQDGGNDIYFLRWRLDDAVTSLAGESLLDVG
jgi:hypothetical protein